MCLSLGLSNKIEIIESNFGSTKKLNRVIVVPGYFHNSFKSSLGTRLLKTQRGYCLFDLLTFDDKVNSKKPRWRCCKVSDHFLKDSSKPSVRLTSPSSRDQGQTSKGQGARPQLKKNPENIVRNLHWLGITMYIWCSMSNKDRLWL